MNNRERLLAVGVITLCFVFAGAVAWVGGHEWALERSDWNALWMTVWGLVVFPVVFVR